MRTRPLAALMLVFASTAGAQPPPPSQYHATVSSAGWWSNNGAMYTTSNTTLTVQLPAASQIPTTSNVVVRLRAVFDVSMGRYHVMIPVLNTKPNLLTCYEIPAGWLPTGTLQETPICALTPAQAKSITQDQTITVTMATTTGNRNLTLVVKPYTGPNYVAPPLILATSGNRPNDLITFRVKLMSPAAQSQAVAWGLSPANCFAEDSPGTKYNSAWTLNTPNTVTFNVGDQQRDLTVRIANTAKCAGANRKLEVWSPATTSTMQGPAYNVLYFTINPPI